MTKRKFRVLNPRKMDPGVHVIAGSYQGRDYQWFVGDELAPPPGMPVADLQWLLEQGLIEELAAETQRPGANPEHGAEGPGSRANELTAAKEMS